MATKPIVPNQQRGRGMAAVGKQKPAEGADGKNRRILGDIGNLVNVQVIEGKPQPQISRPITRSFCAQLLANAQAQVAAAANKKSAVAVDDSGAGAGAKEKAGTKVGRHRAAVKPKPPVTVVEISPDTEETKGSPLQKKSTSKGSSKKKVATFTSILTTRSKVACGISAIDDIDAADSENQLAVVDYVEDIYKFYKLAESSSLVHDYMGSQIEINDRMRSILVDWLIETHQKFELMPETLYLTIHIVDRYLSMKPVLKRELQLVGIGAMLIASKYEEIWAPEISDFICISDNSYLREHILYMEKCILNKLEWSLTLPTLYVFLVRFLKAAAADEEMKHLVFFFAELALLQYSIVIEYCPSMIAAAAVYAAQCTLNKSPLWSETLNNHTGFTELQLMDCVKKLVSFHSSAAESKRKVVYLKYSSPQRSEVALLPPATKFLEVSRQPVA